MAVNYTNRQERSQTDGADARELPPAISRAVIKDLEQVSAALQLAEVHHMNTREEKLTFLETFPEAEWLTGTVDYPVLSGTNASGSQRAKDSQPKKTTNVTWNRKATVAQEMAIMVAIPDAYIDDSGAPLFDEIKPLITTEFSKKLDQAVLFGYQTPFVEAGIVENAIVNGNIVLFGTGVDLADDLAKVGERAAKEGVNVTKFVTEPGFDWRLFGLRNDQGTPIYTPPSEAGSGRIYGRPHVEVTNGTWESDLALALAGEWDKVHIGIRQDITFTLHDEGTIYDPATGLVKYSAVQQDGKILRAVMRVSYVVVNPVRHLGNIYPFWVLQDNTLS